MRYIIDSETETDDVEPYRNAHVLRQKHEVEGKSAYQISEELDCSPSTVMKYLRRCQAKGLLDCEKHRSVRRNYEGGQ